MPKQIRKTRFTLIEMITVLVLIIILFGAGTAALMNASSSKGSEGGARMVSRMLELTRQYAIAQNARVALVMPMQDYDTSYVRYSDFSNQLPESNDLGKTGGEDDKGGVVLRPAVVDRYGNFIKWVEGTKWEVFPSGAYFVTFTTQDVKFDQTKVGNPAIVEAMPGTMVSSVNGQYVPAIIFKGNGSFANLATDAKVFVKPFSTVGGGSSYSPGGARRFMITQNWLTGKIVTTPDTIPTIYTEPY